MAGPRIQDQCSTGTHCGDVPRVRETRDACTVEACGRRGAKRRGRAPILVDVGPLNDVATVVVHYMSVPGAMRVQHSAVYSLRHPSQPPHPSTEHERQPSRSAYITAELPGALTAFHVAGSRHGRRRRHRRGRIHAFWPTEQCVPHTLLFVLPSLIRFQPRAQSRARGTR
jgi:hypothetical protein